MEVDHDIFHFGVVDGALGLAAPRILGVGVIIEQADQVDRTLIDEVETLRILDATAEHEVKLAHARPASSKSGACEPGLRGLP